ncbi:MAG: hypothetical protein KDD45_13825, partial [Bdellovibrionales bacterium]|nr:hypothetical protein [Bdellovibrionales bacterium]
TGTLPSKCPIKCGGINTDGVGIFKANGTWELFGVQRKYTDASQQDYEEFPLKVTGKFSVSKPIQ